MIYFFESKLPENKSIFFALTYVYGLGNKTSAFICKKLGFSKKFKVKNLSNNQIQELNKLINNLNLNLASDLKKTKLMALKNLISIKSYRGFRRKQKLPVRGQRTHTNARTIRKI